MRSNCWRDDDARLLAGGQSLIATLNMRLSHPALAVDINGVGGLDRIVVERRAYRNRRAGPPRASRALAPSSPGARRSSRWPCRISAIPRSATAAPSAARSPSPIRPPNCRRACSRWVASWRSPGRRDPRAVKADDFFKGLFETALTARDVLTAIRIPAAGAETRVGFAEFARRHGDYAMVGLAASARGGRQAARAMCAWPISASAPRRCARSNAEPALGGRRHRRGGARARAGSRIRPTTCRRRAR